MTAVFAALPPRVSRPWIAIAGMAWVLASILATGPTPLARDSGPFAGEVTLAGDVYEGRFGPWAIGEVAGGAVLVSFSDPVEAGRGDTLEVTGSLAGDPGTAAGRVYGAVLTVREVVSIATSDFLPHRAGRLVRDGVIGSLEPFDDGRALLAGFLIGETAEIAAADVDAMRRSGLAHFVAVSGSNVALFLALLAVAAGPLALGPKRRALIGLLALPIYAAATRFEPSVMRASVMAGIALGGRIAGFVLEAWQLLSLAVAALVALDPSLTSNVGFQLSVVATAGVLVGARWPAHGVVARALAVTLGAQLAVAPLLVVHFGTVPLLSPLVNLVAGPIVAAATVVGAVGVAGVDLLVPVAAWLADIVLALARGASSWPQLSGGELAAVLAGCSAIWLLPRARPLIAAIGSLAVSAAVLIPGAALPSAGVVVLDVGQGDALLVHGGDGRFALVDGGPDASVLVDKLRDYGVREVELAVLTHVHADHATGLTGVLDTFHVGHLWSNTEPHVTSASLALLDATEARGITVSAPSLGTRWALGALELVVEGPVRRYASPNDQSIVISVIGPSRTMLLSGDIETHAQDDLEHLRADVLKVPHQGAATSDAEWLSAVGSDVAVISVGPNQFGHPEEWVIELLARSNTVYRTDVEGDVVIDLSR